jgi:hypothetical protein
MHRQRWAKHGSCSRLSRREFLLGAVLGAQAVIVAAATESERRGAYHRAFDGFEPLSDPEFYDLVATYAETPVPLYLDTPEEEGPLAFRFTLPTESVLYVSARADADYPLLVHPLVIERESGHRFLLPLVRSSETGRSIATTIQLGRFEAGEHRFTLTQDRAVAEPIPSSLRLQATRPVGESLLTMFMDHNPVVKLKNLDNVLDDIPLMAFCKLHKRDDRYKVTSFIIFSSENGGTTPVKLMRSYRRTLDVEWVMQQLFEADGGAIRTRRRFQGRDHRSQPYEGAERIGNSPVLATATANNNFSDGWIRFWRWTFRNPFAETGDDAIYFSPKPLFLPSDQWSTDLLERVP